jgi:colicin import membrane protein
VAGQAGASGGPEARGSAQQSSGPSSGYGSKVAARIRPNIRYTEEFPRSLRTEIEVRALSDGTITSRRVVDGSGNAAWDDAALKAIDRTGSLPRDVDGRVPSPIIVVVRPTD